MAFSPPSTLSAHLNSTRSFAFLPSSTFPSRRAGFIASGTAQCTRHLCMSMQCSYLLRMGGGFPQGAAQPRSQPPPWPAQSTVSGYGIEGCGDMPHLWKTLSQQKCPEATQSLINAVTGLDSHLRGLLQYRGRFCRHTRSIRQATRHIIETFSAQRVADVCSHCDVVRGEYVEFLRIVPPI